MDGNRFDDLSRWISRGTTRRGSLRAALGALLAGGTVVAAGEDGAARPALCRPGGRYCTWNHQCCNNRCRTGKRFPIKTRNVCDCTEPDGWCGTTCTHLAIDKKNCGACGHTCLPGETCHDGACWRQLGMTCDRPEVHGHECEPDLVCDDASRICVLRLNMSGCATDNTLCEGDLVCRIDTCLVKGEFDESCDEDADCAGDWVCKEGLCANACYADGAEGCTADEDCCTVGEGSTCVEGVCLPGCCESSDCTKDYEGNVHCFGDFESASPPDEVICTTNVQCVNIYSDCLSDARPDGKPCICISGAVNDIFFDFTPPDNRGYCYQLYP